jgi:hypothetical protein
MPGSLDNIPRIQWWDVGSLAQSSGLVPRYDLPPLPQVATTPATSESTEQFPEPANTRASTWPSFKGPHRVELEQLHKQILSLRQSNAILRDREEVLQGFCWLAFFVAMVFGASSAFWYHRARRVSQKLP